jgi:hypothetical protein
MISLDLRRPHYTASKLTKETIAVVGENGYVQTRGRYVLSRHATSCLA